MAKPSLVITGALVVIAVLIVCGVALYAWQQATINQLQERLIELQQTCSQIGDETAVQ